MKITSAHGTPEQFEAAVRKRIQELSKDDDTITSAADPAAEVADTGEYITALYHGLRAAVPDSLSINMEDEGDDNISFVASDGDRIVSFKVPYSDMKFDWTHFEDDIDYILTAVNEEFAADSRMNVHNADTDAASNILASDDDEDFSDPLEAAQMSFESGHYANENDFKSDEDYQQYLEYMDMGPEGFYEEFKDDLDFDEMFVAEYGYDE